MREPRTEAALDLVAGRLRVRAAKVLAHQIDARLEELERGAERVHH